MKKRDKCLDLAKELKSYGTWRWYHLWLVHLDQSSKDLVKGLGRLGNKRTSRDHPDYSIIKIGQNTEKSPADSRRLAVIHTPAKKPSGIAGMKNSQRSKIVRKLKKPKKRWNMKVTRNGSQVIGKETGRIENQKNWDHIHYSIVKIS